MTAIDELRRLLDERGVEWWEEYGFTYWKNRFNYSCNCATGHESGMVSVLFDAKPEQAVEATLGRGTCRFIYEDNYNETEGCDAYSWFRCSACGWTFDECDRWLTTMSYCPNCGRRIEVDA